MVSPPVAGQGLSLYKFLSPNAYPQLSEHVQIINKMAVSHVYDVRVCTVLIFQCLKA